MSYTCDICKNDCDIFEHPSQILICANKHCVCKDCKAAGNFVCEECRETKWHFLRVGSVSGTPATGTQIVRCVKTEAETKGRDLPEAKAEQEVCKGSVEVEIQIDTVEHADAAKQDAEIVKKPMPEECQVNNRYFPLKDSQVVLRLCGGADSAVDEGTNDKKEVIPKLLRACTDAMKEENGSTEKPSELHEKEANAQLKFFEGQKRALNAAACTNKCADCKSVVDKEQKQSNEANIVVTLDDGRAVGEAHALEWPTDMIALLCEVVDHVLCEHDTTAAKKETESDKVKNRHAATQNAEVFEKQKPKASELGKQCCDTLKVKQVEVRSKAGDDKLKHENINDRKVEKGDKSEINKMKVDLLEKCLAAMKELNKITEEQDKVAEKETKAQLKTLASQKRDSNTAGCSKERCAHQKDTDEKEGNKPSDVHTLDPGEIPRLVLPAYYVTCMNCQSSALVSERSFYGHSITVEYRDAATQCTEIPLKKEAFAMKKPLQEKQVLLHIKADVGTQKDNDAGNKNEIWPKKSGAEEMAEKSYNKRLGAIKKLIESKKELNESKKELNESKKELNESKKKLNESKKELNESKKELNESNKELNELPEKETNVQLKTFGYTQESSDGGSDEIQINMLPKQDLNTLNNSPTDEVEKQRIVLPSKPVKCANCRTFVMPYDFNRHVDIEHGSQGYIYAGISRQFTVSVAALRGQKSYYFQPYIFPCEHAENSFGHQINGLPVFVNMRQIMLSHLIDLPSYEQPIEDKAAGYIFWVSMLVPPSHSFSAALTVWNLKQSEASPYSSIYRAVQSLSESNDDLKLQYENSMFLSMRAIEFIAEDDTLKFDIKLTV